MADTYTFAAPQMGRASVRHPSDPGPAYDTETDAQRFASCDARRAYQDAAEHYAAASLAANPNVVIDALELYGQDADDYMLIVRDHLDEAAYEMVQSLADYGFDPADCWNEFRQDNLWAGEQEAIDRYQARFDESVQARVETLHNNAIVRERMKSLHQPVSAGMVALCADKSGAM